ncbi:Cupin 2 conserved barrel domain protein [Parvibaculum lavamentivorans DS-1]|uniref:Cupin 2 conserved barrel domain protein n=1 Tax=Parvibaculum lavamentivorans (strain DS-1 / DSM 13023 / NCIMB 13966) TaxID=402881 RepID=A7HQJ1_PARL1|nr:cupin domain-containing protein [Parvibaculum lavamentivorans]ABS62174.1 Cupin 2 conserved barrel domain protein [Parvibaculum lavamentivorans DS-1]
MPANDGKETGAGLPAGKSLFYDAARIAGLAEKVVVHQFNPNAVRHTRSLGDMAGLEDVGVHVVRVEPGRDTTEHHFHGQDEEFLFILSGRALATIGDDTFGVGPGDFMAFPKNSPAHSMHVPEDAKEDLVYLMGGTRSPIDVCTYPRLARRMYRVDGVKEYADLGDFRKV